MQNTNDGATIYSVVPKSDELQHNTLAETPSPGQSNVIIQPMNVLAILAIKAGKIYFDTVVAILLAAPTFAAIATATNSTDVLQFPHEFWPLVKTAFLLGVGPALISVLRNVATYLTSLEQKLPALSA